MTELLFPDIASDLFDDNDICSSCGSKLIAADRIGEKLAIACVNRNCRFRYCSCATDLKKGIETAECPVHWKCDCRQGYLCNRHRLRPHRVQKRYKMKGKEWCDATGFSIIHDQANLWIEACNRQEKKALAHCGSCFSPLIQDRTKSKEAPDTICRKGCKCLCATGKTCYVHLTCGCLDGYELCQFHKAKRLDVIVALSRALPSTSRFRLTERMSRAGITPTDYPQRGRRPEELDIRALVRQSGMAIIKPDAKFMPTQAPELYTAPRVKDKQLPPARPSQAKKVESAKAAAAIFDLASDLTSKVPDYKDWLAKQGLSHHSVRNYLSRINGFIANLREMDLDYPPLSAATKELAIRDLKEHLKNDAKVKPATLNSYLAAIDNFYGFLGMGKSDVVRE